MVRAGSAGTSADRAGRTGSCRWRRCCASPKAIVVW